MPVKSSFKDKLEDDVLDISLMQLEEVPVQDIASLPKGTTLDLSNNLLVRLPDSFPTLTYLIKLDLSKNRLVELPEYFGNLKNLRHLDLYSNQLEKLPLSFCQLRNLKWLDLKNNPLVGPLQQAAGPCITPQDCGLCAKKVVALLQSLHSQMEMEKQRLVVEQCKAEERKRLQEEAKKERLRVEKRAAKERRRMEARAREEFRKQEEECRESDPGQVEFANGSRFQGNSKVHHDTTEKKGSGCWKWMLMLLFATGLMTIGVGFSLIWIYTGGNIDQLTIERSLPILKKDVGKAMTFLGAKVNGMLESVRLTPAWQKLIGVTATFWEELGRRNEVLAKYINDNLGPTFCEVLGWCKVRWQELDALIRQWWKDVEPILQYFRKWATEYTEMVVAKILENSISLLDFVHQQFNDSADYVRGLWRSSTAGRR